MTSRHQDDPGSTAPQLDTEASHWLLRLLDKDPDPSDPYFDRATRDEAFMDWLASSPEHVRAFLVTFEAYYRLGQVDRDGLNHVAFMVQNLPYLPRRRPV
jgi:ferric-dicitrate binding protein FerR (iron transport regulator)